MSPGFDARTLFVEGPDFLFTYYANRVVRTTHSPPTSSETILLNCSEARCSLPNVSTRAFGAHGSELFTYRERFRASGYVPEAWTV